MKDILRLPAWWIPGLLLLIHQVIQYALDVPLPFVDDYLDPFLIIPVLLGLLLMERRLFYAVDRLSALDVIVSTLVLAVLFEEVFPRWQPEFVRDGWDYLAYALGSCWFWWMINPRP